MIQGWRVRGAEYEIDSQVAHSGKKSLKISITPQDVEKDKEYFTGIWSKRRYSRGDAQAHEICVLV